MGTGSRRKEQSILSRTDLGECPDEGREEKGEGESDPEDDVEIRQIFQRDGSVDRVIVAVEGESIHRSNLTVSGDVMNLELRRIIVHEGCLVVSKKNDFGNDATFECGLEGGKSVSDDGMRHANSDENGVGVGSMRFDQSGQRGESEREVMGSVVGGRVRSNFGTERSDQFEFGKEVKLFLVVQVEIDDSILVINSNDSQVLKVINSQPRILLEGVRVGNRLKDGFLGDEDFSRILMSQREGDLLCLFPEDTDMSIGMGTKGRSHLSITGSDDDLGATIGIGVQNIGEAGNSALTPRTECIDFLSIFKPRRGDDSVSRGGCPRRDGS